MGFSAFTTYSQPVRLVPAPGGTADRGPGARAGTMRFAKAGFVAGALRQPCSGRSRFQARRKTVAHIRSENPC